MNIVIMLILISTTTITINNIRSENDKCDEYYTLIIITITIILLTYSIMWFIHIRDNDMVYNY